MNYYYYYYFGSAYFSMWDAWLTGMKADYTPHACSSGGSFKRLFLSIFSFLFFFYFPCRFHPTRCSSPRVSRFTGPTSLWSLLERSIKNGVESLGHAFGSFKVLIVLYDNNSDNNTRRGGFTACWRRIFLDGVRLAVTFIMAYELTPLIPPRSPLWTVRYFCTEPRQYTSNAGRLTWHKRIRVPGLDCFWSQRLEGRIG